MQFKRLFLIVISISLSVCALMGISIFLFGNFNEVQGQVLATTLAIGFFSVLGLMESALYNKGYYKYMTLLSFGVTALSLLFSFILIWTTRGLPQDFWKVFFSFTIVSISLAHASLLLTIDTHVSYVRYTLWCTLACIVFVAGILIYLVLTTSSVRPDMLLRLLGTFAILDVLGTILTPLLHRFAPIQVEQSTMASPPNETEPTIES